MTAYLALAITGLATAELPLARSAYLAMEVIARCVIVPFGIATLIAGLVESLGTSWGLFRHWWVVTKLVLTTGALAVLLQHLPVVNRMAGIAGAASFAMGDARDLRLELVVHAAGGLVVLLTATVLSVWKPWGLTPYGRFRLGEARRAPPAADVGAAVVTPRRRWPIIVGVHALALLGLAVPVHLFGGGLRAH